MRRARFIAIHDGRSEEQGQSVVIDVTYAGGGEGAVTLPYGKVPLLVRALLVGHLSAAGERRAAGTLDSEEHVNSFRLSSLSAEGVRAAGANHVGLALTFEGGGVLPVVLDRALSRELGQKLIDLADRTPPAGRARH